MKKNNIRHTIFLLILSCFLLIFFYSCSSMGGGAVHTETIATNSANAVEKHYRFGDISRGIYGRITNYKFGDIKRFSVRQIKQLNINRIAYCNARKDKITRKIALSLIRFQLPFYPKNGICTELRNVFGKPSSAED